MDIPPRFLRSRRVPRHRAQACVAQRRHGQQRHIRRRAIPLWALLVACVGLAMAAVPAGSTPSGASSLEPATSGGLASLDRALVRLSTHKRLLVIAAHPDDEDTTLLTWVARGLGGEAAYLSLSRGDGGQNLIGPEVGADLGLLRSQELLSARHIDGARQFFSRAYDFGFTRSIDETLERWPKEVLLEDTARVVRRFKPQVLMSIFPSSARAGHGQHWAAGLVAEEIFALAGDASAFPELDAEGLAPWPIDTFFRAAWFNPEAANVEIPLGTVDPWSGRSIFQIALASRSQHRCQDMGNLQPPGDATGRLTWQAGAGGPGQDVFAGIDTSLPAMAAGLAEGDAKRAVVAELARVETLARDARTHLSAVDFGVARGPVLEIVQRLRAARAHVPVEDPQASHVLALIDEKLAIAQEAAATAAEVIADAVTDRETVVPGGDIVVRSLFWNAGPGTVTAVDVEVESHAGWPLLDSSPAEPGRARFTTQLTDERALNIGIPADAAPTVPYFRQRPLEGDLYDWQGVAPEFKGEPFAPSPLRLRFTFEVDGVPLELMREVVYRARDQVYGEVRRPLRVVPGLEVRTEPSLLVWPTDRSSMALVVDIASNLDQPVSGRLELTVPEGWPAPDAVPFTIADPRGRVAVEVTLVAPEDPGTVRFDVGVAAVVGDTRYTNAYPLVDYEHIRPTPRPQPAAVTVSTIDLGLPNIGRVGYVPGASDRVGELLASVGLPIEFLDTAALTTGDLSVYDAIVIGPRAYEVNPVLAEANPRLLAYTRAGGLTVVQYQQYQFVRGEHAPFALDIHRPHDRVTDETAPVRLLVADHPAFQVPNALADGDWEGWVQERGLYFGGTWDEAWQPLLAMADPGGEEKQGSLLVAPVGEGTYVYTGLAFFRQLPAGVPGGYRLFANLLALGDND